MWIQLVAALAAGFDPAQFAVLKAAGIETKSLTQSEKINVAIINDPDGNQIIFAQGQHEVLR